MLSKLIEPPSMAASRGAISRRTGNAKVLVSFSSFNGKTLSFSHKPFRVRPMFIRKVTEHSAASSPNKQEEEEEEFTSQIKEALKESQKSNVDPYTSKKHGEVVAMVGLDAMKKANSTLEDFIRSYFMFHELEVTEPQSIFKYLPVLSFTESYVYQMDALNEKIVSESACGSKVIGSSHGWNAESRVSFETVPFKPLEDLLERDGLLTQRMQQEFRSGEEYWALERKLCCDLSNKNKICLEDVMRADHLRSFDYRVLNLLIYKLRGEEVNELHMEFLSISAFLVEVADDLLDYEDDVLKNSFNILRMFVGIYGSTNAPTELAKMISEAEEKYKETMKSLDPHLSSKYQRRCEEAIEEGGENAGRPLGTWSIPELIPDEEAYRAAADAAQR